ncbi:hypothetical protein FACS189472_00780 [Alphaproteobacteria bacterium]|nr:hypothetical protein FACS189472_00780 [Alphaproteobacteria bacterium]
MPYTPDDDVHPPRTTGNKNPHALVRIDAWRGFQMEKHRNLDRTTDNERKPLPRSTKTANTNGQKVHTLL